MKSNNNYTPRPPMGDWFALVFFGILAIAALISGIKFIIQILSQ